MKYLIIFLSFYSLSSCIDNDSEKFKKECPYEFVYGTNHKLEVPITVSPHKLMYSIGDTISFKTAFSDSILDINTQNHFLIKNFPFKPILLFYRFYDGLNWDSGLRVNEYIVDSLNNPKYNFSGNRADNMQFETYYNDSKYYFELKLVLKEKGRYIMLLSDLYEDWNASGNSYLNDEANEIEFEGKCPLFAYNICSIIQGDSHIDSFTEELLFLDKEIYHDNFYSLGVDYIDDVYGDGLSPWEWYGAYGFIVE